MTTIPPISCPAICETHCDKHRTNLLNYYKHFQETLYHIPVADDLALLESRVKELPKCLIQDPKAYLSLAHDLTQIAEKIFDFSLTGPNKVFGDKQAPSEEVKKMDQLVLKTIKYASQTLMTRHAPDSYELPKLSKRFESAYLGHPIFRRFYFQSRLDHKPPPNFKTLNAIHEILSKNAIKSSDPIDYTKPLPDKLPKESCDSYKYILACQILAGLNSDDPLFFTQLDEETRNKYQAVVEKISCTDLKDRLRPKVGYQDKLSSSMYPNFDKHAIHLFAFGYFEEAKACERDDSRNDAFETLKGYFSQISPEAVREEEPPYTSIPSEIQEVRALLEQGQFEQAIEKARTYERPIQYAAYENILMACLEVENWDQFLPLYDKLLITDKREFEMKHQMAHPDINQKICEYRHMMHEEPDMTRKLKDMYIE